MNVSEANERELMAMSDERKWKLIKDDVSCAISEWQ